MKTKMNTRDKTILDNVGLIGSAMKTFFYDIDDADDLFSEGMIGLILATDRFDPTREYEFSTFAYPYIRGYMCAYFKKKKFEDSLDEPLYTDSEDSITKLDILADDIDIQQSYEDEDHYKFRMGIVDTVLEDVTEIQAKAFRMLMSGNTYHEISKELGISICKLQQYVRLVDRKINHYIFKKGLRYV